MSSHPTLNLTKGQKEKQNVVRYHNTYSENFTYLVIDLLNKISIPSIFSLIHRHGVPQNSKLEHIVKML